MTEEKSLEIKKILLNKKAYGVLTDFEILSKNSFLNEEIIDEFLNKHSNFFGSKSNKKLKKEIEKFLKSKIQNLEIFEKGPTIEPKERSVLKERLNAYFSSPDFLYFIKKSFEGILKINVSLYGSLVTGFSSQYSKYKGLPSDYKRVSDVDLGITINDDTLKKIGFDARKLYKKGNYLGPFSEKNAEKTGPFVKIFSFLKNLSFAKRTDRKIAFVLVDESFYKNNLVKTEHIPILIKEMYISPKKNLEKAGIKI